MRDLSNGKASNSRRKAASSLIECLEGPDTPERQKVIMYIANDVKDRADLVSLLFLEKDKHFAKKIENASKKCHEIEEEETRIRKLARKRYEKINGANIHPSRKGGYSSKECKKGSDYCDRIWDYAGAKEKEYGDLLEARSNVEQKLKKAESTLESEVRNPAVCLAYVKAFVKPSIEAFKRRKNLKVYFPDGNQLEISPNHKGVADAIALLLQGKELTVIQGDPSYNDQGTILRGPIDDKNRIAIVNWGNGHYSKATEIRKK
jgi:hypothetical protein